MNPISLTTILIFSSISAFAGLLLLRIGIRGRRVSSNPHCRKCKFDLHGLNLDEPLQCPECGVDLKANPKAILPARFRTRKLVILLSSLFLMISATGFAWPKISKIPSIQTVDIYNYFPESLLVRLATTGDSDALQTLHDRLIPGNVSSDALASLIDAAFKHHADEATAWDERWGDVFLYAMYNDQLEENQLEQIAEGSFRHELVAHTAIGPSSSSMKINIQPIQIRGGSSPQFESDLFGRRSPWDGYIKTYRVLTDDSEIRRDGYTGSGVQSWVPYKNRTGYGRSIDIPIEQDKFMIRVPIGYEVQKDNVVVHQWETMLTHEVIRLDTEPEYITINEDLALRDQFISEMRIGSLSIPTNMREMAQHESIRSRSFAFAHIHYMSVSDLTLMGRLYYRLKEREVPGREIVVDLGAQNRIGIWPAYDHGPQGWLKEYIDNEEFWNDVLEVGSVDVIYRPDPSLAEQNPGYSGLFDTPIIFRSVKIEPLETEQIQSTRDHGSQIWVYKQEWRALDREYSDAEKLEE